MSTTTPDLPVGKTRRRRRPNVNYEIRTCDGCARESLPRAVRSSRQFEVPCACGSRSFSVFPLRPLPARASTLTSAEPAAS